jgi:hypothetical protein
LLLYILIYHCRLSLETIRKFTEKVTQDPKAIDFITTWHRACRSLFSDDSLSLRTIKQLLKAYKGQAEQSDSTFLSSLAAVLLPKMPFLGPYCCYKFTQYLWEYTREYNLSAPKLPESETLPLRLLVRTALVDVEGKICSFPEFSSNLKAGHTLHPVVRMAAWVRMVWTKHLDENKRDAISKVLGSLTSLKVIDQVKFPYIEGETATQELLSFDVYSKSGDFSDILWLADAISHGY